MNDETEPDLEEIILNLDQMPEQVLRLVEVMSSLDSTWKFVDWLVEKTEEEINFLTNDLELELLRLRQKLYRINSISKRMKAPQNISNDDDQRNLFDCFDLVDRIPKNIKISSIDELDEPDENIPHPSRTLLEYLPGELIDDPLLAMTAQLILVEIDKIIANGRDVAHIDELVLNLSVRKLDRDEIDEAINHLILQNLIYEIDENCFIPTINE